MVAIFFLMEERFVKIKVKIIVTLKSRYEKEIELILQFGILIQITKP